MKKITKKEENQPKRKYEFQAEKAKKKVLMSVLLGALIAVIICGLSIGGYKLYSNAHHDDENTTKNSWYSEYVHHIKCTIPYSYANCHSESNDTVANIKAMLNEINGNNTNNNSQYFDGTLTTSIKAFQKKNHLIQTGTVNSYLLKMLAKKTNRSYYEVYYNKAFGRGILAGTTLNNQVFLNNDSVQISSTILTKKSNAHVGYTATTTMNGKIYYYGCDATECVMPHWYSYQEKKNSKKFNMYVIEPSYNEYFDISENSNLKSGQKIMLTAKYCPSNKPYYIHSLSTCNSNNDETIPEDEQYQWYVNIQNESNTSWTLNYKDQELLIAILCDHSEKYTESKALLDQIFDKVNKTTTISQVIRTKGAFLTEGSSRYYEILKQREFGMCSGPQEAIKDEYKDLGYGQ